MKTNSKLAVIILILGSFASAGQINITPKPAEMITKDGYFRLSVDTNIVCEPNCKIQAEKLRAYLQPATGFDLKVLSGQETSPGSILLKIDSSRNELGKEGYSLDVSKDAIRITSPDTAGLFYGIQTLRQLLPAEIYSDRLAGANWKIPCVTITDSPTYTWRGMMLDVSRYFFDVDYVKRYLEMMAMHKLNVLHLHLVDDPGWRIQIDKYPLLTQVGGFRDTGSDTYGGFYTKDEIREIVSYASQLNIEIVPEIELPAHCQSALAAYPWLGCSDKQFEVPTKCYISHEILCAGKDSTYTFLKDVLTEVAELFPGKFIHIGGDEVKCDRWTKCDHCNKKLKELGLKKHTKLQSYMTLEIEKFLMTKGKRLIGWDEILDNGLAPNATVMTWHRPKTAVQAAKAGNNVVMALTGHAYFDTPESKLPGEPPAATWLAPISLQKAYEWEPAPTALDADEKKFILGAHGCLWTDRFMHNPILQDLSTMDENRSFQYVDYLSLPRMAALAEVVWTNQDKRNFNNFTDRQTIQYNRYSAANYHFRVPLPNVEIAGPNSSKYTVTMTSPVNNAQIRFSTNGTYPTAYSTLYIEPITINDPQKISAITVVSKRQYSLAFKFPEDKNSKFSQYGEMIGQWKSGKISAGTYKPIQFDATGRIDKNGDYEITFIYTGGTQRLDIEKVEIIVNGKVIATDKHYGTTGGTNRDNVYKFNITKYETGANYTVIASVMGDTGNDSNGVVLIKKVK